MPLAIKWLSLNAIRSVTAMMIWYVLQKRELTRFYQQITAKRKEAQVSNILDSNGDAIIVVQLKRQETDVPAEIEE